MTDPYIYSNGVLRNKFDIDDYEKLNQAEADIGFAKLMDIDSIEITYFDEDLIKRVHKHIFEDIFDWAGEYRTVPLIKYEAVLPRYTVPYSEPKNISKDLKKRLNDLNKIAWQDKSVEEISYLFSRKLALLWKVHPFRDGNTRTILSFAFIYAKEHGFQFDIQEFINELNRTYRENGKIAKINIRDMFVLASLPDEYYPEIKPLARVFEKAISKCQTKEEPKKK